MRGLRIKGVLGCLSSFYLIAISLNFKVFKQHWIITRICLQLPYISCALNEVQFLLDSIYYTHMWYVEFIKINFSLEILRLKFCTWNNGEIKRSYILEYIHKGKSHTTYSRYYTYSDIFHWNNIVNLKLKIQGSLLTQ